MTRLCASPSSCWPLGIFSVYSRLYLTIAIQRNPRYKKKFDTRRSPVAMTATVASCTASICCRWDAKNILSWPVRLHANVRSWHKLQRRARSNGCTQVWIKQHFKCVIINVKRKRFTKFNMNRVQRSCCSFSLILMFKFIELCNYENKENCINT